MQQKVVIHWCAKNFLSDVQGFVLLPEFLPESMRFHTISSDWYIWKIYNTFKPIYHSITFNWYCRHFTYFSIFYWNSGLTCTTFTLYKTSNQKIQKMSEKFLEFQASFIDNILVVDTLRTIQVAKVYYWKWWFLWLIEKWISSVIFIRILLL